MGEEVTDNNYLQGAVTEKAEISACNLDRS